MHVRDDFIAGGRIFQIHLVGQENPSFLDHFKRRSENTQHIGGYKDLHPRYKLVIL